MGTEKSNLLDTSFPYMLSVMKNGIYSSSKQEHFFGALLEYMNAKFTTLVEYNGMIRERLDSIDENIKEKQTYDTYFWLTLCPVDAVAGNSVAEVVGHFSTKRISVS